MRSQTLFQNWEDVLIDGVPAFLFLWCCSVSLLAVCGVVVVLSVCGSLWLCWFLFGGGRWFLWWSVVAVFRCLVLCGFSLCFFLFRLSPFSPLVVGVVCLSFFLSLVFSFPSFVVFLLFLLFCFFTLVEPIPYLKFFPFPPFYLLVDLICVVTELQ